MKNLRNKQTMHEFEDIEKGLTDVNIEEFKNYILFILKSSDLLQYQKKEKLAHAAVCALSYPLVSKDAKTAIRDGVIDMLAAGSVRYHPRYIAPDYERILKEGSDFLDLKPAQDLHDATCSLLTAYNYFLPPFFSFLFNINSWFPVFSPLGLVLRIVFVRVFY